MMERRFECQWASCPRQGDPFNCPEELALHVEEDHVDPCAEHDLFICQWEGCKVYNRPSYSFGWLQRHVRQMHTKERPNKCLMNGCNMSFNSVDALQKHMLRHFEDSPTIGSPSLKKPSKFSSPAKGGGSVQKSLMRDPVGASASRARVTGVKAELEGGGEERETASLPGKDIFRPKKKHSLKVRIPRKTLVSCSPYPKVPVAFNGAHFHSELMDGRTMSVIRHTTNTLARSSAATSIMLSAKVIGERKQSNVEEPEVLVRWTPQVVPDEWIFLSDYQSERVVHFSELPHCQLSNLASKCFGYDKLHGRRSKRKP